MFTVKQGEDTRDRIIKMARQDHRIVSCALVGSSAEGTDRWSDIDITFGGATGLDINDVLRDWTEHLLPGFKAVHLFDLPYRTGIYRVLMLPESLQVDLSFFPESGFGAHGPRFKLLYGVAVKKEWPSSPRNVICSGWPCIIW